MKYDFTSLIDRHGMDAIAVDSWGEIPGMAPNAPDEGFDRIPMWVADMNFATVPTVQEHIIQRAQHPMFGYFDPRPEYFDRIIEWQSRRNGVEGLLPEHIGYENGVLGGVVSTLRAYVQPGDAVLVHSPTYIGFTKSIEAAGYRIVHSPLKLDDQGVWRMDLRTWGASSPKTTSMLRCSAHRTTLAPRMGARRDRARHGYLSSARLRGDLGRDLVRHHHARS